MSLREIARSNGGLSTGVRRKKKEKMMMKNVVDVAI